MGVWADAPDMKIGNAGVARGLDQFADLVGDMIVGTIQQHPCRVAHQRDRPTGDDDRTDNSHHRVQPYPTEIPAGQQGGDGEYRCQGIGEHVNIGSAQIIVLVAAAVMVVVMVAVAMAMAMTVIMRVAACEQSGARQIDAQSGDRDDRRFAESHGDGLEHP